MSIQKGDFILLDYTAKIEETGKIFDTTLEDVAKNEKMYKEGTTYESLFVVVGEGWLLKGLDEQLVGLELNNEVTTKILPEKGFGIRDPKKIKLIPLRSFRDTIPRPNTEIEINGKIAVVRAVGAGRVQVDFNPQLAGKTLIYNVNVKKVIEDEKEKMLALIHRRIPSVGIDKFHLDATKEKAIIEMSNEVFYLEGIQFIKKGVANDIQKFFPSVNEVTFIERYTKETTTNGLVTPSLESAQKDI
jgi:peptidylprolyl isomerase